VEGVDATSTIRNVIQNAKTATECCEGSNRQRESGNELEMNSCREAGREELKLLTDVYLRLTVRETLCYNWRHPQSSLSRSRTVTCSAWLSLTRK